MTVALMLDAVKQELGLHTDIELCHALGITAPVMSKLRAGAIGVGPAYLVRMHEATGMSTKELKALLAAKTNKKARGA